MTPQEAFNVLQQVAGIVKVTLAEADTIKLALQTIKDVIDEE